MTRPPTPEERRPANQGPLAAARNRAALIAAAREVYAAQGLDAPLTAIARRAGVGQGSLYRHFPDRAAVAAAVLEENVRQIERAATGSAALLEKLLPSFRRQGDREAFEAAYEVADAAKMNEIRARVEQAVADPDTAEKLKPWYRYACKRPSFSDLYYPASNRDNVTLVDTADTHGIERVTASGVVVGEQEYALDCLVFATGFSVGVSGILSGRLAVQGRGGAQLLHLWAAQGPRTLHGFTSHGFPNLLQMGSLQNAAGVNFTHVLDEQAVHAAALVAAAEAEGALIEPSREAEDDWLALLAKEGPDHEWFHAECTPGYYNREGMGRPNGPSAYPHGAVAFHELLRRWREESLGQVLRPRTSPSVPRTP